MNYKLTLWEYTVERIVKLLVVSYIQQIISTLNKKIKKDRNWFILIMHKKTIDYRLLVFFVKRIARLDVTFC